jgi:hypothetical protein
MYSGPRRATAGERIVGVRNLKIRVHTLKHGCLLPSHGRKVRADEIGHQHGLSVRGSVALAGDGQHVCSRDLKFQVRPLSDISQTAFVRLNTIRSQTFAPRRDSVYNITENALKPEQFL